jgi:MFS family permease
MYPESHPNYLQKNTAVYSTFAVFGFFGGTFVNRLGVKMTLAFGGIGYCIYAISLLVSVHKSVDGFNIFAGALLGVCAGLLWTAQGTIMISYPHEDQKGRYFAWFWAIFNMGAVIGSLVRFYFSLRLRSNNDIYSLQYGFLSLFCLF